MSYNEHLQELLLGIKSSVPIKGGVKLTEEGYEIFPHLTSCDEQTCNICVNITFKIHHPTLLPFDLKDTILGHGTTKEQAIGDAVRLWVEATLPVLHYLHHGPKELSKVTKVTIKSKEKESSNQFDLICGPVLGFGYKERNINKELQEPTKLVEILQPSISSLLNKKDPLCIFASISKSGDTSSSHCSLNNKRWNKAEETLHWWADKWGYCETRQFRKQFIICTIAE